MHGTENLGFEFNWIAMVVAAIASLVLGWIWFGPIWGKKWAAEMGMEPEADMSKMLKPMLMTIVGAFVLAYALTWLLHDWAAMRWGTDSHEANVMTAFMMGLFGLMVYVPMLIGGVAWEKRSWTVFMIDGMYAFLNVFLVGIIVGLWT